MHCTGVERIFCTRNAQEACSLFESLRAETLDLHKVLASFKRAIFIAKFKNAVCKCLADSRYISEQRFGCAIEIHAHHIYAAFYHFVEALLQFALVHIMLILTDANRLRVNFYKLCKRILQTATNGDCTARGHIFLREFFDSDHGCGVHRSTRLIHDHLNWARLHIGNKFSNKGIGFATCGAITNRDEPNIIGAHQLFHLALCTCNVALWFMWKNHAMIQELTVLIHHGNLNS